MRNRISTLKNKSGNDVNLADFFLSYPWKVNRNASGGIVKMPYVKESECVYSEKSVSMREYSRIINSYYGEVLNQMIQGEGYRFTSEIGDIRLVKYKSVRKGKGIAKLAMKLKGQGMTDAEVQAYIKDNPKAIDEMTYHNAHLMGHKFNIAWFRHDWNVLFGNYWNFKLSYNMWMKAWNHYLKHPEDFLKLQNSTKVQR